MWLCRNRRPPPYTQLYATYTQLYVRAIRPKYTPDSPIRSLYVRLYAGPYTPEYCFAWCWPPCSLRPSDLLSIRPSGCPSVRPSDRPTIHRFSLSSSLPSAIRRPIRPLYAATRCLRPIRRYTLPIRRYTLGYTQPIR